MSRTRRQMTCTPEAIFEVLTDGWLYAGWVVGASRVRLVESGWPSPGTAIHHSFGIWPVLIDDETRALEYVPNRLLRLRARGWPMGEAEVVIEAEPAPGGTAVTITEDAVAGPGTLVPKPARDAVLGVRNKETLQRLAMLAEGGAGR